MNRRTDPTANPARRRFLVAALLTALAGCTGPFRPISRHGDASDWITGLFGAREGMARFGTAYLEAHPGERDPALLFDAVVGPGPGADALPDPASALAALDRAVRAEYRSGDVVSVEGWLLSRSEARLYALATLV